MVRGNRVAGMVSRSTRALNRSKAEIPGRNQLTLAYLIILLERIVVVYENR